MYTSSPYITTMVINSQADFHHRGYFLNRRNGDNGKMRYPNRICELATSKGIYQAKLAKIMNKPVQEIERFWNGKRKLDQIWISEFAKALQCRDGEILETAHEEKNYIFDDERIKKCGAILIEEANKKGRKLTHAELIAYTVMLYKHGMEYKTLPERKDAALILQFKVV